MGKRERKYGGDVAELSKKNRIEGQDLNFYIDRKVEKNKENKKKSYIFRCSHLKATRDPCGK